MYGTHPGNERLNKMIMDDAGFVLHKNCKPFFAYVDENEKPKNDVQFKLVGELDLCHLQKKCNDVNQHGNVLHRTLAKIKHARLTIEKQLQRKREELILLETYTNIYPRVMLKDLAQGKYQVMSIRNCKKK